MLNKDELELDSEEEDDELLEELHDANAADIESLLEQRNRKASISISEAPTFVSEDESHNKNGDEDGTMVRGGSKNSFDSCNEEDTDDDESISRAETYRSESDESVETPNQMSVHSEEPQVDENDSVFNAPPVYRKAESVISNHSATGSTRARLIEKSKQQKADASVNGRNVSFVNGQVSVFLN